MYEKHFSRTVSLRFSAGSSPGLSSWRAHYGYMIYSHARRLPDVQLSSYRRLSVFKVMANCLGTAVSLLVFFIFNLLYCVIFVVVNLPRYLPWSQSVAEKKSFPNGSIVEA